MIKMIDMIDKIEPADAKALAGKQNLQHILKGILAAVVIMVFYVVAVATISSQAYLKGQLAQFWYYIAMLSIGFGIQIGLYSYLKSLHCAKMPKAVFAASSTSSILAMLACCAHYLITILPVIGIMSFVAAVYKYQVPLFWIGLLFSAFGIINMLRQIRIIKTPNSYARSQ